MTQFVRNALLAMIVTMPSAALAGGYGTAGVKDATVGQSPTATATVWCPKLKTDVPIALHQQMDCGEGAVGTAKPAVARERFGGRGLFGLPPHQPSGPRSALDDSDTPVTRANPPTGPGDDTPSDEPEQPTDEPDRPDDRPPSGGPKTKWERLADFGVNSDNFFDQPDDFRSAVQDFRKTNGGYGGDWSGFDPAGGSSEER